MNEQNDIVRACAFTGHRPERLGYPEAEVIAWLATEIQNAIRDGCTTFISGMQRGVDLWAAEEVLRRRGAGQPVRLVAAAAFRGMEDRWSEDWKRRYERVLHAADKIVFVSDTPGRAAFFERNRYMVDHAARLIAVYCGGGGGTLETIRYAERKHRKVIRYGGRQR